MQESNTQYEKQVNFYLIQDEVQVPNNIIKKNVDIKEQRK